MFSQGISNFSNHILLLHKYGQVKLKLNADLMSHNFSSDLWDSVSRLQACFVSCAILNGCKSREGSSPGYMRQGTPLDCAKAIEFWDSLLATLLPHWFQELLMGLLSSSSLRRKCLLPFLVGIGFIIYLLLRPFSLWQKIQGLQNDFARQSNRQNTQTAAAHVQILSPPFLTEAIAQ